MVLCSPSLTPSTTRCVLVVPCHAIFHFTPIQLALTAGASRCCAQVGAAISMVYTSGAPVMFVGCGQTYVDLKRLNTKEVVNSLLG